MARYYIDSIVNVVTGDHSEAYRSEGKLPAPQITIPRFRARLSIEEADRLRAALRTAITIATTKEQEQAE